MSLEAAIQENTATMKQLIDVLKGPLSAKTAAAAKPEQERAAAPKAAQEVAPPKTKAPESAPKLAEGGESEETLRDTAKKLILQIANKNRTAAVDMLGSYGATKATELTPDKLKPFITDAKAWLAA